MRLPHTKKCMSASKMVILLTLLSDPAHPFRCVAYSSELFPANSNRFTPRCDWTILSFGSNLAVQGLSDVSSHPVPFSGLLSLSASWKLCCELAVLAILLGLGLRQIIGIRVLFSTYIGDSPGKPARFSVAVIPPYLDCVSADASASASGRREIPWR
jgi:hypothetical protein